ncbi:cbb3-type cytochrome oxidase assembly protein CcoS [Sansalvadorimonas verongulae]|uniref:cbb3-type cytochrome oxidase assembly protein CcoS n=1 Tax=Sansalvadorimonas verongulae TaxID=2172824 RepID=UPI0012BCF78A|nr:cbb3-type cytochrome oxidase assembly protein CcoS [Sansalvadorimonas verongulae]MTI12460.1 cbb3-type cytochrome oxidase assembly protein CcoS [Sansalvadorimonas verongulae]
MDSLYILVPIAVVFVAAAVWIFFWAVDNNQFDDLEGPAHSILFDEPNKKSHNKNSGNQESA